MEIYYGDFGTFCDNLQIYHIVLKLIFYSHPKEFVLVPRPCSFLEMPRMPMPIEKRTAMMTTIPQMTRTTSVT